MGTFATMLQTHLEYIRSCEEIWQKGMYVELHAYQHYVFMDWRFVDDSPKGMLRNNWELVISVLNGTGVESMTAKWDEMFGEKKEEVVEEVRPKKPRKKTVQKVVKSTQTKTISKAKKLSVRKADEKK